MTQSTVGCGLISTLAINRRLWTVGCCLVFAAPLVAETTVQVREPRVEYRANPLGVDVAKPRFSWILESERRGSRQTAYQILVASRRSFLDKDQGDIWDSGRVRSDQSVHVPYEGPTLASSTRYHWKVRVWDERNEASAWGPASYWVSGLLEPSEWQARWIGGPWSGNWEEESPAPLPWLRKTFELDTVPREAFAFVAAMGYYELYINGKKVDDHVLMPAVSHYPSRVLYVTHDVRRYLVRGRNCIALWLGQGWNVPGFPGVVDDGPIVRAQVQLDLPDGRGTVVVGTDETWKVHASPITPLIGNTSYRNTGEAYDARLEVPGWNETGLDDAAWPRAEVFDPPSVSLTAHLAEPNRRQEAIHTLEAIQIEPLSGDAYRIDMGRNFTGWLELDLDGAPGQKLTLEYLEQLDPKGRHVRYRQLDEYILKGGGPETFSNRFNYHGFRWVVVRGLERAPERVDVRGYLVHTDFQPASLFESSNPLIDQIYRVARWTQKSLSLGGYSVDCPHRERLGYGAEGQATMEEALYNFDLGAFYTKWVMDWRDVQDPETGELPHIAPAPLGNRTGGGPGWGGIIVTLPWQLYLQYGDMRILQETYPAMTRWLSFLEDQTRDGLLEYYGTNPDWHFLGDWNPPGRGMSPGDRVDDASTLFFNNCYFLYNVQLAAKIADVLGETGDASRLASRARELQAAIHQRFFRGEGRFYGNGEQVYLAFPLLVGVVPEELRPAVLERLEETLVRRRDGHLDSGVLGTYFWLKYLTQIDRSDLVYRAATRTSFPGWGYMLEEGASTFWEQWDGANSRIHSSYLSIGAWLFEGLGGVRPDPEAPGFRVVQFKPPLIRGLDHVRAEYDSIRGRIRSQWERSDNMLRLQVLVPANARGRVFLPTTQPDSVTESGVKAGEALGVGPIRTVDGFTVVEVESGRYSFAVAVP
jgi:alpha-L-rhamnosidase